MRAYITRHAEAVPREQSEVPRLLTQKGRTDARHLGLFLKAGGIGPARVLHNGRTWVQQNAEIVAEVLETGHGARVEQPAYGLNSGAEIAPLIADLTEAEDDVVAALPNEVAHRVASHLIAGQETPHAVSLDNGGAICLERGDDGHWHAVWLVTAQQLADLAD
jgi:phosphohistidine phosphatase SixA